MNPRLLALATQLGGVFTASDAARVDVGESELRRLTSRRVVVRLRRGAYVLADAWESAKPEGRLALRTRAVMRTRTVADIDDGEARPPDAASHQSALALRGLPLHGIRLDVVDVIADVSRVRLSSGLRTQPGKHPTVVVDGVRAVTIPIAIAQVLQRSGLLAALVPLDAALHQKKCSLDAVGEALDEVLGADHALSKRLMTLADPKCDSVGETRTRLLLHDLGYEARSQVSIHDENGGFIGRVDFLVGARVVVEFDGLKKYDGADGRAALVSEKRREDRLRALGFVVVRLTWADLDRPERVGQLMKRAVAQAERRAG